MSTKKPKTKENIKKQWEPVFQKEFREDLQYWVKNDRKIALRILNIIEAILREPFTGIGKPEALKHLAQGI